MAFAARRAAGVLVLAHDCQLPRKGEYEMSTVLGRQELGLAVVALLAAFVPPAHAAGDADAISDEALQQIQRLEEEKAARTPEQMKLDSQLLYACEEARKGIAAYAAPEMRSDASVDEAGGVLVDIDAVVSPELLAYIENLGGQVVSSVPTFNAIRAQVPVGSLELIAGQSDVRFIEPAAQATTNLGSVTTEGDTTHQAAAARTAFSINGTGVNVGVLSDSVDFLAGSQASGDLGAVTVLAGQSGINICGPMGNAACTGEGTAMLEIVADLAPAAPLFFATGFSGVANMAANILALQAAGCNVIVDDVTYFNESPFQDGPIAQAVNAVSAAGVLYFSSARNSGNLNDATSGTWEGDFVDGGAVAAPIPGAGRLHSFGPATFNTVTGTGPGGNLLRVDLFWSDPLGASANDYDLFILNATGTTVLRSSTNPQTGTQNPYESNATLNVGERIVIVRVAGAGRFLHLDIGRGILTTQTAGSVRGHNAAGAANAFSVAATSVANSFPNAFTGGATNPVETFSSDGPRRIFFNPNGTAITPGNFSSTGGMVLQKPDITAADNNMTSVPGFNPFGGTSAAAPHAAAIAALLIDSTPGATPNQIRTALTSTALDIEAPGVDRDSGAGIVMAPQAIRALNPLDHFQCYALKPGHFDSVTATVVDQFGSSVEGVRAPNRLCAPADKDGSGIGDPTDHLTAYELKPPRDPRFQKRTNQTVVNQFGTQQFDVLRPSWLMVPSGKDGVAQTPPLDHFQCYVIKPSNGAPKFVPRTVTVSSQIETVTLEVVRPFRLCAPADMNGEDPTAPSAADHLLCYKTRSNHFGDEKHTIQNQFGQRTVQLISRNELCVPSLKNPGSTTATVSTSTTSSSSTSTTSTTTTTSSTTTSTTA
jgi:hypothetical protein